MKREIEITEITADKLMNSNDMAKVGSNQCEGCFYCCTNMGKSIVLDPYDVMNLCEGLGCDFPSLLGTSVELSVVDGIILPNLLMKETEGNKCHYLNKEGRCSIHSFRPGICRLFPLGRIYDNGTFKYFLQSKECIKENRTKVKIKSFLGVEDLKSYEEFVTLWHYFLNEVEDYIKKTSVLQEGETLIKNINMLILNTFYITAIGKERFFEEVKRRIDIVKAKLLEW